MSLLTCPLNSYVLGLIVLSVSAGCVASAFPLHEAAREGKAPTIERILNQGGDVNASTPDGYTPLMMAVLNHQLETVKLLLARGADANARTLFKKRGTFWFHPFHVLITKRRSFRNHWYFEEEFPRTLIDGQRIQLGNGYSDFTIAVLLNSVGIELGKGYSALMMAALLGNIDLVQALINGSTLVDGESELGVTPLLIASGEGHAPVVKALLSAGANVNHRDKFGRTPLIAAVQRGSAETLIQAWLKSGAGPTNPIGDQQRVTIYGVSYEYMEVVKTLLAAGAAPNAKALRGYDLPGGGILKGDTPLSIVKRKGYAEIVQLLEQAGATEE